MFKMNRTVSNIHSRSATHNFILYKCILRLICSINQMIVSVTSCQINFILRKVSKSTSSNWNLKLLSIFYFWDNTVNSLKSLLIRFLIFCFFNQLINRSFLYSSQIYISIALFSIYILIVVINPVVIEVATVLFRQLQ